MTTLVNHIDAYLSHLNTTLQLYTSIHLNKTALERLPGEYWQRLSVYNAHQHPYCMFIKHMGQEQCLLQQQQLHSMHGKATCCVCHAGVCQYIHPITIDGMTVGFAAVSGFRTDSPPQGIDASLWERYLSRDLPFSLCDTVIPPLCLMLEQLLMRSQPHVGEDNAILQYLNEYHTDTTLNDVCNYFQKSRSHISHTFKATYGMSLRAYCNRLKLEDARHLLIDTDLSVTRIAVDTGFGDTSYFIHLFRQTYGTSPLRYRKSFR
jgi:AraC-like DNA-binding protein